MNFALNEQVQIRHTTLTGTVKRFRVSDDGREVYYLVGWKDHEGIDQERNFTDTEIEKVTP